MIQRNKVISAFLVLIGYEYDSVEPFLCSNMFKGMYAMYAHDQLYFYHPRQDTININQLIFGFR